MVMSPFLEKIMEMMAFAQYPRAQEAIDCVAPIGHSPVLE
jgi:hypothetical protein